MQGRLQPFSGRAAALSADSLAGGFWAATAQVVAPCDADLAQSCHHTAAVRGSKGFKQRIVLWCHGFCSLECSRLCSTYVQVLSAPPPCPMVFPAQGRDLRILDPHLLSSYPSAILCRERALVVSLENIKVIITTDSVLVTNPEEDGVLPFITDLKLRLGRGLPGPGGSYSNALDELASSASVIPSRSAAKLENLHASDMPFELRALEVCLDSVSCCVMLLLSLLLVVVSCCLGKGRLGDNAAHAVAGVTGRLWVDTQRAPAVPPLVVSGC